MWDGDGVVRVCVEQGGVCGDGGAGEDLYGWGAWGEA